MSLVTSHFFHLKFVFFSLPIFAEYSNNSDANIFVLRNKHNAKIKFAAIVKPKIKTNLIIKLLDGEKGMREIVTRRVFKCFYFMATIVLTLSLVAKRVLFSCNDRELLARCPT